MTSCGAAMGADHIARFELAEPSTVSIELVDGGFLGTLALRSDCDQAASEAECFLGADAVLEDLELEAGVWFVVVKDGGGLRPELWLRIREG